MPKTFEISDEQLRNINKWLEEHSKTCPYFTVNFKYLGSPISYIFTPDSIGTGVIIKCICGKEADVSDYDNF